MTTHKEFLDERVENVKRCYQDHMFVDRNINLLSELARNKYYYNFDWLGLPIIAYPQDVVALQEIIWKTKPDVIIETGVARGGSVVLSASILHLVHGNDHKGLCIGIDIDIRPHAIDMIEKHPLAFRIRLLQGSSLDRSIIEQVIAIIEPDQRVMVILDSDHTEAHVLEELERYSPLVTKDCYLVVMDTGIEDDPGDFLDRPWGKGNNPKTAVHKFLKQNNRFEVDDFIHSKLLQTAAPDGYLKCVK
ncbi:MAG: cephalosporin hydroxylase family protein [Methylovulum sp.]|jgi:cephalosporin hydroxylase|nr:cephalosporin hydroxylase family protein [Methylovulum sp.]MCF7997782.1 cephalosporin hydroxylase family protein [Methylovulum sp.]MCF8494741.1 cephalosporin hydroxylase family protein [Rickettsiaceae bacterium]